MDCNVCDSHISKDLGSNPPPKIEDHLEFGSEVEGAHYIRFERGGVRKLAVVSIPGGTIEIITQVDPTQELLLQAKNNVLNLLSMVIRLSAKLDQEEENFVADELSDALHFLTDHVSTPAMLDNMTPEGLKETLKLVRKAKIYIKEHEKEMESIVSDVNEKQQMVDNLLKQITETLRRE